MHFGAAIQDYLHQVQPALITHNIYHHVHVLDSSALHKQVQIYIKILEYKGDAIVK